MNKVNFIGLCKKNGLFTCGSVNQYSKVIDMWKQIKSPYDRMFEPIVHMTWICSDTEEFTIQNIRIILATALFEY